MCLAVPAQIVELNDQEALADMHGNRVSVSIALVPQTKVGDWVLLHAGFAIQRLQPEEAKETFGILADIEAADAALAGAQAPEGGAA